MKKALLVVSFGTTYHQTMDKTIGAVERELAQAFPDRELRRAFTSGFVRRRLWKRDQLRIDGVVEALEALHIEGYEDVLIQPTHMINGEETERMMKEIAIYFGYFQHISIGKPLLTTQEDYEQLADAIASELPSMDYDDAVVLMGHGTSHHANPAYAAMEYVFHAKGHHNIFVGTVEGYPTIDNVIDRLNETLNTRKVYLIPMMIVAGDHAVNDMAGNHPDSWKKRLMDEHFEPLPILNGLGENAAVRQIFIRHAQEALGEHR